MSTGPLQTGPTRREAIGAAVGLTLAGAASGAQAQPGQVTANGTVFEDTDGSFRRTAGSRGVPGILASNGRDVATNDAQGRWSLAVRPGNALLVIKPTGWMTETDDATQLPRFSVLYLPDGTPEALTTRFQGIAPTGTLPDSVDFALRRQAEPAQFNAADGPDRASGLRQHPGGGEPV